MTMRSPFKHPGRRDVLRGGLAGAAGLALPLSACGSGDAEVASTEIADGIVLISAAGSNVVATLGGSGVVLVDGGPAETSEAVLRRARATFNERTIEALINTHWHPEHTGSNVAVGQAGGRIIAHENTRLWLTTDIHRPWEDVVHAPMPAEGLPTDTFYSTNAIHLANGWATMGYALQAHTDGDTVVAFGLDDDPVVALGFEGDAGAVANVLCVGGVLTSDRWPVVDWWTGGWIGGSSAVINTNNYQVNGGLAGAAQQLLDLVGEDTTIVPAHGPLLTRADLEEQAAMYAEIAAKLREMLFSGLSPEEAVIAEPTKGMKPEWGDPTEFITLAFQSLWGHYTPDA